MRRRVIVVVLAVASFFALAAPAFASGSLMS
jgi:hypothetical protein